MPIRMTIDRLQTTDFLSSGLCRPSSDGTDRKTSLQRSSDGGRSGSTDFAACRLVRLIRLEPEFLRTRSSGSRARWRSDRSSSSRCQIARVPGARGPRGEAKIRSRRTSMVPDWWSQTGSNRRPPACKAGALPTELWPLQRTEDGRQKADLNICPSSVLRRPSSDFGGPGTTRTSDLTLIRGAL